MKYIFTFHSNITFLSALSVAKFYNYKTNDVIFLSNNYKVPLKKFKYFNYYDVTEKNWLTKLKNFNYPKAFDNYITTLIGGDNFIAYIDLMSSGNRILITHENCKGFHFLEEGIVNYYKYDNLRLFTIDIDSFPWRINYLKHWKLILISLMRIIRGRSLKLLNLPIHPGAYVNFKDVHFYCFSEKAYSNVNPQKKIIIPFKTISEELKILTNGVDISNSLLWLGDTACKFYKVPITEFETALRSSFDILKSQISEYQSKIYIKFKNGQSIEEKEVTLNVFRDFGLEIRILPEQVIMEAILLNSKNVMVLGNATTLLIYASIFGHKTYSIFNRISDKYNIPLSILFPDFSELVGKL